MIDPKDDKQKKIQIDLGNSVAQGVYANLSMTNFNPEEMVLDFLYIQPNLPKGTLRSRVILSPKHAKRLSALLERSVSEYETKFGAIDDEDQHDGSDISFSVNYRTFWKQICIILIMWSRRVTTVYKKMRFRLRHVLLNLFLSQGIL